MDQEYISKEAVLDDLRLARSLTPGLPYEGPMAKIVDTFFDMIATYPAADVAPVKQGRWVDGHCDQCGCYGEDDRVGGNIPTNFCPNCGAKMY